MDEDDRGDGARPPSREVRIDGRRCAVAASSSRSDRTSIGATPDSVGAVLGGGAEADVDGGSGVTGTISTSAQAAPIHGPHRVANRPVTLGRTILVLNGAILVLSNMYPPHHMGGYELSCRDVVDRWRATGHDVTVLTSTMRLPGVDDPPDERGAGVRRDLQIAFRDGDLSTYPLRAPAVDRAGEPPCVCGPPWTR